MVGYYMLLLCQWLCHLCGELWYHTRAEGFTYVSFTHTHTQPDYQLTPSQWGAGGGRATHKEPTRAPSADSRLNSKPSLKHGCHQPTLIPCQPIYVRPAHYQITKSLTPKGINCASNLLECTHLLHNHLVRPCGIC
jgi:hypothetical protein